MKISAALACYNGEKYILEQLQSILEQTRKVDEVIITDDRSTDRTAELVREFISSHGLSSWKFTVNERNLGFAENFRRAIDGASGDYIFLCDQDDIWLQDRVEIMSGVMESRPEIGLLNTEYASFRQGENELKGFFEDCGESKQIKLDKHTFFLRYPGCVMCVRKSLYDDVKSEWYQGWAHDEFLWNMALLRECCYYVHYCSLKRRFHEDQTSGRVGHTKEKRITYLQGIQKSSEHLKQLCTSLEQRKIYEKMYRAHSYRLALIRDKKWTRAVHLLAYLGYYHSKKSYLVELMLAWKGRV